jgi:hypothetical protein
MKDPIARARNKPLGIALRPTLLGRADEMIE